MLRGDHRLVDADLGRRELRGHRFQIGLHGGFLLRFRGLRDSGRFRFRFRLADVVGGLGVVGLRGTAAEGGEQADADREQVLRAHGCLLLLGGPMIAGVKEKDIEDSKDSKDV